MIDLRSDTVTLPSPAMREAIFNAELGDDVFGDDPTVNRLQEKAADLVGKEAALLVPSGTMANLVSVLTHCRRGEEVILGSQAHMFWYECGSMSAVGGIHPHTIPNQKDGTILLEDIERAIRPLNDHFPRTRLICLENTHNRCRGAVLTPHYMDSVGDLARQRGLMLHMDGARIFNAAVALGVDAKNLSRSVDSLSFCLSKSLACPIGSLVCGSKRFVAEARRMRKQLGGGMRQAGIIAAAGLVALDQMIERLSEDHANARVLAQGISNIEGLSVDIERVQTNMVYLAVANQAIEPQSFLQQCRARGLDFVQIDAREFRMVTHYGIEKPHIDKALGILHEVVNSATT
ncbi:MAG: low-specificity L-threonine aldolase [Planctomycetota bacterium]|jgi:threonine aldolase